jgi:hypothetical protein
MPKIRTALNACLLLPGMTSTAMIASFLPCLARVS